VPATLPPACSAWPLSRRCTTTACPAPHPPSNPPPPSLGRRWARLCWAASAPSPPTWRSRRA
jgi:hypothetical protein